MNNKDNENKMKEPEYKEEGKDREVEKTVDEQQLVREATELLQKKNQERIQHCWMEIQQVLRKHGCVFEVGMLVTPQGNRAVLNVVSRPEEMQS